MKRDAKGRFQSKGFVIPIPNALFIINPLASPGEEVSVFTYLYLSAGAPALGEAKGLIIKLNNILYFLTFKFFINPLTSPSAGAPTLKYRYVNTETSSHGEAKGLINGKGYIKE